MEPHSTRHSRHSCDRPNTPRHTHNSKSDSVTAVMGGLKGRRGGKRPFYVISFYSPQTKGTPK